MSTTTLGVLIGTVLASAGTYFVLSTPADHPDDPSSSPRGSASAGDLGSAQVERHRHANSSAGTEFRAPTFLSDSFLQARTMRSSRLLEIDSIERFEPFPEFTSTFTGAASFDIRLVAPRFANDWFLFGVDDAGAWVLARWIFDPPQGAVVATRPVSGTPIGTPVAGALVSIGPKGGTYVAPEQRHDPRPERRLALSRDLGVASITAAEADPDGRFVLFATGGESVIYQRGIAADDTKVALFSAAELPLLGSYDVQHLIAMQHPTFGRVVAVEYRGKGQHDILLDADNDGVFEDYTSLPLRDYNETFFDTDGVEHFYRY